MDERKRKLKGSPLRDAFKQWHKTLPREFFSTDLDFVFISKSPNGIVAALDYKGKNDSITFSECIAYNTLAQKGIDVFLFSAEPETPPYSSICVWYYAGGDPKPEPPVCNLVLVLDHVSEEEFIKWEGELRKKFQRRLRDE